MNGRQLVLNALRRKKTERAPWVPFVGVHGAELIGVTAAEYLRSADHLAAGLRQARTRYQPDGLPIAFDLQIEAEMLGCELAWSDDGPPSVAGHPLQTSQLADLPDYDPTAGRMTVVLDALRKVREELDDIALYGLICGPLTLAMHLRGNELFLDMFDDEERVAELMMYCADIAAQTASAYIDAGADVIAVVDPMTSQISPEHFTALVAPALDRVFDAVHGRDVPASLFVCGDATRNLAAMAATHCDNISVDENVSLPELREAAGAHGKSIGGNLQLTGVLLLGSAQDSRRDAVRCLDEGGECGFVLSPGCDLPWGVPPENLETIGALARDTYLQQAVRAEQTAHTRVLPAVDWDLPAEGVRVDVVTLDSTSCAPCQYMLDAAQKAAATCDSEIPVIEHKIKSLDGLAMMQHLGVAHIPTICINGEPVFSSIIPSQQALVDAIQARRQKETVG